MGALSGGKLSLPFFKYSDKEKQEKKVEDPKTKEESDECWKKAFTGFADEEHLFNNILMGRSPSIINTLSKEKRELFEYFSFDIFDLLKRPENRTIRDNNIYYWKLLIKYLKASKNEVIQTKELLNKLNYY